MLMTPGFPCPTMPKKSTLPAADVAAFINQLKIIIIK
jgi:hypothetical protein